MMKTTIFLILGIQLALAADHKPAQHAKSKEVAVGHKGSFSHSHNEEGLLRRDSGHGEQEHEHKKHHRHSNVHPHTQELLEERHGSQQSPDAAPAAASEEKTVQTTPEPLVNCGGHQAKKCSLCTVIDPSNGLQIEDRGADWCHGDCTYFDGECHTLTSQNLHIARDDGLASVSTTEMLPDLLNPEITKRDKEIMDTAAQKSVDEAEYEAQQRLSNLEQEEKEKKGKFLMIVIVSASCVLACCAIASVIALLHYTKKQQPKQDEEPLAEDDGVSSGGEEGEEAAGEVQGEQVAAA